MNELEKRIIATNDWGLMAILHEGLIDNFKESIQAIEEEKYEDLKIYNNSSRDILAELIVIFKDETGIEEISQNFREIYLYVNKLITEGENKRDEKYFKDSIKVITPLLESFLQKEKETEGRVVSGLTYGSEDLKEYDKGSNFNFEG